MKHHHILRTVAVIMAALAALAAGMGVEHTLTSNDGRTLEVRLVNKSEKSVGIIRISDGRWFDIPIETLAEADREFIKKWSPAPDPAWNQQALRREMVKPLEGFSSMELRRARRPSRSRASYYPVPWMHSHWFRPAYVNRFHYHPMHHTYHCYRRPVFNVTIRR